METIMEKLEDMLENDFGGFPENINCDNQFNVPEFTDFFTEKGTNLWFSQPDQPHKNAIIERFWRTLALLLQRMRTGIKNFDWVKALPDVVGNYNSEWHRSIKAKPIDIWEGKKENSIERKVVESVLKKGMHVRIKTKKTVFDKGDVQTLSRDIYEIIEKTGKKNTLKNLTTGNQLKRTFTDEELEQTFAKPEERKKNFRQQELQLVPMQRQKVNPKETIAQRREHRVIKIPSRFND
jgi:hypothetical protein